MEKCIDIYSRLLIATITFIVPIIINLLSTFAAGEKRRRELYTETEDQLNKSAVEEIQANPDNMKEMISKTHKQFQDNEKKTKTEISRLNPLIQFWKIFTCLALSLLCLMINYLIRDNTWNLYNHNWSIITISASITSYLAAIFLIIRILYTISRTKKIIEP